MAHVVLDEYLQFRYLRFLSHLASYLQHQNSRCISSDQLETKS